MLALIMVSVLFVSCAENNGGDQSTEVSKTSETSTEASSENSEETSASPANPYMDSDGNYHITNELKNFGGEEFSIIVRGAISGTYQSDDFTTGSELYGETLDAAVTERNRKVEDTYGVTLKIYKNDNIQTDITTDISGGTQLYDAIMPTLTGLAVLAADGNLIDLGTLDDIHLDAPWYDPNCTDAMSINHQYFFTTGDMTILNKVNTSSILFNKEMIAAKNLEDPYELVRKHQWTYDKMKEMAKEVTADTDGEDGMSGKDTWGMLSSYADSLVLYNAADKLLCTKDADDYPILAFGDDSSVTVIQKILQDMEEENTWVVYAQQFEDPIWVTSLNAFIEGRVLFRPSAFSATTKLRIAGADFGIVPLPLWSEEQENYRSFCGGSQTAGIAISIGCEDPEYSAYMIEAISCESKKYITPAYMDINLKSKDAQDEESLEMLNIIFNNIVYDIGFVYNFGGIGGLFERLCKAKSTDIVSSFRADEPGITAAIEEVIEAYLELED